MPLDLSQPDIINILDLPSASFESTRTSTPWYKTAWSVARSVAKPAVIGFVIGEVLVGITRIQEVNYHNKQGIPINPYEIKSSMFLYPFLTSLLVTSFKLMCTKFSYQDQSAFINNDSLSVDSEGLENSPPSYNNIFPNPPIVISSNSQSVIAEPIIITVDFDREEGVLYGSETLESSNNEFVYLISGETPPPSYHHDIELGNDIVNTIQ